MSYKIKNPYLKGFRDSVAFIESLGFEVEMPHLLSKNQKEYTAEEANESRCVTKIRWVVESVNGRLKIMFPFFQDTIHNNYLNKVGRFLRIACAMINAFCPPLNKDVPQSVDLATYLIERYINA